MSKLCVYLEVRLVTAELDILTKAGRITTNSTVAEITANCDLRYNFKLRTTSLPLKLSCIILSSRIIPCTD